MEERGLGPPSRRTTAAIGQFKSQWLFFFPFSFCPLYCNMNFVKAATCCHAKRRVVARRDPDWLIGSTQAKWRADWTQRVERSFGLFLRLCLFRGLNFTFGCDEHLVIITNELVHWCFDAIYLYLRSFFLGYIGPINRKKTHLIISRLGSAWILFVLSGVKFEFVTKKKIQDNFKESPFI